MRIAIAGAVVAAASVLSLRAAPIQGPAPRYVVLTEPDVSGGRAAAVVPEVRSALTEAIAARIAVGELQQIGGEPDGLTPGRAHQSFRQMHRGVRVFGGGLQRQLDGFGRTVSMFGAIYPDIGVDTTPAISQADATTLLAAAGQGRPFIDAEIDLFVLPHEGEYRLAWSSRILARRDGHVYRIFIDALTGNELMRFDDTQTQVAVDTVGRGLGLIGDPLKVSAQRIGGSFRAVDILTPGLNTTYDMRGDAVRADDALDGRRPLTDADIAVDSDNLWGDPAVVSTHSYASLTYHYFYTRFQRQGINNNNLKIRLLVNPARREEIGALGSQYPLFFANAAYYGGGYIAFGVGNTANRNFAASLDIVAHEIVHGLTAFTSGLIYFSESGALNESFSDMMGVAIEFAYQLRGGGPARAEWLQGEDVPFSGNGLRNFATPQQRNHPDHYSIRFLGSSDNGGVHTNSSIMNHAFYLAIEGGTHRLGGVVQGVGFDNREQIERVIYRAFTSMLPSNATFAIARGATLQAARDLYGQGSAAERALAQAFDAVGVQ